LGIGDWGLGIGDCPIPNPQSPLNSNREIILKSFSSKLLTFNKLIKLI